jgi:hypothetical protein
MTIRCPPETYAGFVAAISPVRIAGGAALLTLA